MRWKGWLGGRSGEIEVEIYRWCNCIGLYTIYTSFVLCIYIYTLYDYYMICYIYTVFRGVEISDKSSRWLSSIILSQIVVKMWFNPMGVTNISRKGCIHTLMNITYIHVFQIHPKFGFTIGLKRLGRKSIKSRIFNNIQQGVSADLNSARTTASTCLIS